MQSQSLDTLSRELDKAQTYSAIAEAAFNSLKEITKYNNLAMHLISEDKEKATIITAKGTNEDKHLSEFPTISVKGDPFLEYLLTIETILFKYIENYSLGYR